ncbi:hypothetical protein BDV18DRAFT_135166 [Aspergillus unguis]
MNRLPHPAHVGSIPSSPDRHLLSSRRDLLFLATRRRCTTEYGQGAPMSRSELMRLPLVRMAMAVFVGFVESSFCVFFAFSR